MLEFSIDASMANVRSSPLAGAWYPAKPDQLAKSVDAYLNDARPPDIPGTLVGVVAPHAGHRYSGAVAGYAFKPMQGMQVDIVALIGPMHNNVSSALLTTGHDAYWTPLGEVPVDKEALAALSAACPVPITPVYNDPEHSLEIELPFLQRVLTGFKLLPIMIRDDSAAVCLALAKALASVLQGRRHLLIASSDLSHFYPQSTAKRLDDYMLSQIESFDPLAVLRAEDEEKGFACGRGAIATALAAAKTLGASSITRLNHATSGDITGDYSSVVGYGAAAIWKL
jgi:MEMO1 family protein